jgi:small GTP-binding protein
MSETKDNNILVKTVLIGESGVGKTSIIKQFVKSEFDPDINASSSGQYSSRIINIMEKNVQFDIWDTAGQEIYHSLAKLFYRDANIIILVYDITNPKSFENLKKYWYKQIKANSYKDAIFALVGNKSDMFDKERIDEKEVKKYAESIGAIFHKTSAKSNSSVEELFEKVGRQFLDPNFDYKKEECTNNKKEDMFSNEVDHASVKLNKNIHKKKSKFRCC